LINATSCDARYKLKSVNGGISLNAAIVIVAGIFVVVVDREHAALT
jgi:hypothetical protein